jgi:hypothetical protein
MRHIWGIIGLFFIVTASAQAALKEDEITY